MANPIREWRRERRLTQVQLAALAEISQSTVADLENDKIRRPGYDLVERLARALGLPVETVGSAIVTSTESQEVA